MSSPPQLYRCEVRALVNKMKHRPSVQKVLTEGLWYMYVYIIILFRPVDQTTWTTMLTKILIITSIASDLYPLISAISEIYYLHLDMQLFNLHCCGLPFVFLLVRSVTPEPSGNDDDDTQSVVSPLLDGSNNPIDALEAGQEWSTNGLFDTNVAPPLVIATDQTDEACPLPPMKESPQRRKVRRGDACTAPLQLKPEERPETKPKPGNDDGASETPGNQINPQNVPSFESAPSWKAPNMLPTTPENCPDPFLNNPVCAFRTPDMTNWVERQYRGITVDLPECYLCMFQAFLLLPI